MVYYWNGFYRLSSSAITTIGLVTVKFVSYNNHQAEEGLVGQNMILKLGPDMRNMF